MASAIAGQLALALLKGIASQIGAKIFNSIFPDSGLPDYFDEVYKEIAKIVAKQIEQNTINEINGQINGMQSWVRNVYTPRKDSGASKQELFDMIQENEYDIAVHMVAVLQDDAYAEPGLGVFVIAAGMHLTLLQELALVDPNVSDPSLSSYAVSVQKYAEEYAAFADATFDLVEEKRTDNTTITEVEFTSNSIKPPTSPLLDIYFFSKWTDQHLGKTYDDATVLLQSQTWTNGTSVEMEERSKKARSDHIQQVKEDLVTSLHDPKGVANLWRQLMEQPIPPQALES
ncbi:uncharacterized protein LOC117104911 [Anneissia japonica]|uniref:uncharacterized protein LOC117104911 n=1 Tax=Anneissia japonica TaxID=1529436 RepID=UPI0014254EDE|nr:uncharacterized protein LOC117104911 [Anneissia japonica]